MIILDTTLFKIGNHGFHEPNTIHIIHQFLEIVSIEIGHTFGS